ncbi:MAG: AI-2E family transporter [Clostridia bacterium]|nr:AI-2E family transporter [Clostridia bacterium]
MDHDRVFKFPNYLKILLLAIPIALVLNWQAASSLVGTVTSAIMPVFYGVAIALILNAPVRRFEVLISGCDRKHLISEGARTVIALVFVMLVITGVVYTAVTSLVPQIIKMFEGVMDYLQTNDLQEKIRTFLKISPEDWKITSENWLGTATSQIGTYITQGLNSVVSVTSSFLRLLISLTIAIYILSCRHSLHRQFRRVASALLPEKTAALITHTASLTVTTVSTWFGRQMLEGLIFGCVMAAAMLVLKLPYVVPISFLSACLYMLPYVGGWLTFFQGFLIMLSVDLNTAVIFAVMVLVLQTLDGNLLNPHLVGGSIGLPPWLALASISFFGVLFGIPGMFLGVPTAAVIVALLKDLVHTREQKKKDGGEMGAAISGAEDGQKNAD